MEVLNGVTIYWLISIGLLVGFILDLFLGKRGMKMVGNLFFGVVGTVVIGVSAILLQLYGALLFAAVGAVAFLFLVNVFSIHTDSRSGAKIINS
ncbi:MAG: hypothetical protein WD355_04580 [Balneolaceae bacterium]